MAKPSGATCNIDCQYCYFLSKEALYPGPPQRMSAQTLELYLRQLLESHRAPVVTVAWQGGEPTLMGMDYFRRAVALIEGFRRPGQRIEHSFQTNGIALDAEWCAFFKAEGILVGLSIDGPAELHDAYRLTRKGKPTHARVEQAWRLLRAHGVDVNILCCVHAANQAQGLRVYRYFRDALHAEFIQFIPIIERATEQTVHIANRGWSEKPGQPRLLYTQSGGRVTERSANAIAYGQFLIDIFDEWLRRDVGRVYVQLFDSSLESLFGQHRLCIHAPTCGEGLALEFNGDLYSCDHFVEPAHKLGNIHQTPLIELVASPQQRRFGQAKLDGLTRQCQGCEVRAFCHGGCPKDRFALSGDGEAGHNYLCEGLFAFFSHARPALLRMQALIDQGRAPPDAVQSAGDSVATAPKA
jgi:uncharacterized protein